MDTISTHVVSDIKKQCCSVVNAYEYAGVDIVMLQLMSSSLHYFDWNRHRLVHSTPLLAMPCRI